MSLSYFSDTMEGEMTFGEVLLLYLGELGISQSELARRMGTGRQTINTIINDSKHGPRLETAMEIARALGVPLQEMVNRMKEQQGGSVAPR